MTCQEMIRDLRDELINERDACETSRAELAGRILNLDRMIVRLGTILDAEEVTPVASPSPPRRRPIQRMLGKALDGTGISFASICADHPDIAASDLQRTLNRMQASGKAAVANGLWAKPGPARPAPNSGLTGLASEP